MSENKKPALIPANVAALAEVAAKESRRYAMNGIRLELDQERGTYTAVATDSKILAIVEGPTETHGRADELAAILASAPNGATAALLPIGRRATKAKPQENGIATIGNGSEPFAVVLSDTKTTTSTTTGNVQTMNNIEGRFPPYRDIIPTKQPTQKIEFDPVLMAAILKTAAAFSDGGNIEFGFYDSNKPAIIRCRTATGQQFTGLIMPLTPDEEPRAEQLKRENATRLMSNAAAMLEAIRQAYRALRNVPQSDEARAVLKLAYDAARPIVDPTYRVIVKTPPGIERPDTIPETISAENSKEIRQKCDEINAELRRYERRQTIDQYSMVMTLEEIPDPYELEPDASDIMDETEEERAELCELTLAD